MASDTPLKPEGIVTATTTTTAVETMIQTTEEQSLPQSSFVNHAFEKIRMAIDRIDTKIEAMPAASEVRAQWQTQLDLQKQLQERWALEEKSRDLINAHIGEMAQMRLRQLASDEKTEKLSIAQDRLADALEGMNDSLKSGFEMGSNVVKLFGRITLVFLVVVLALGLVIVWIAKMDISRDGGKFNIRSGLPPAVQPLTE